MLRYKNIRLIVPEVASRGGIQSYMLRVWEMLSEIENSRLECLSLNDSNEALVDWMPSYGGLLFGFRRNKICFVLSQLFRKRSDTLAIVGHLHLAPVALAAKLIGRIKGYVIILHGIEAWQQQGLLIRWAIQHAAINVATTNYTANLNAKMNDIALDKYYVIPLCTEKNIPLHNPDFKLNGEFPLLMVARLNASEKYKGMEMVIDAVAKLSSIGFSLHFNLVGDGDDRSRLEKYAIEKGCSRHITFWGRLDEADLQAAYKTAAIFVMPSKNEGFGIVFLEAMRNGVPCVGGNHGGVPEVISNGETGFLVNFGDVDSLANIIIHLMNDCELRRKISSNSMNLAETEFSYAVFSDNWKRLVLNYINDK